MKLFCLLTVFLFSSSSWSICIDMTGRFRTPASATLVVEIRQVGCERIFLREAFDGVNFGVVVEYIADGVFRKLGRKTQRSWFEGNEMRMQYFYSDPNQVTGEPMYYVDHRYRETEQGHLSESEVYDINGHFLYRWFRQFVREMGK